MRIEWKTNNFERSVAIFCASVSVALSKKNICGGVRHKNVDKRPKRADRHLQTDLIACFVGVHPIERHFGKVSVR